MESKIICLDTSVLIDYFRKANKEQTYLYQLSGVTKSFAITTVTIFEIYNGCNESQLSFWESIFDTMEILPFDENSSKLASQLYRRLVRKNKALAIPDLFIGAIAINNRIPLATLNTKHFERIEELDLLYPSRV